LLDQIDRKQRQIERWIPLTDLPTTEYPRSQPLEFFGRNRDFLEVMSHERILAGPAETGKTLACLHLLNKLAWEFPNLQGAIVRKTYKSMSGTVLSTFEKKILPVPPTEPGAPVKAFGGQRPERYIYPNGSMLWIGGMDNPDRVLSSERDVIYVNQAEELDLDEWETLVTRATGRAGNIDTPFIMGDCNPAWKTHWIVKRSAQDGPLLRIDSRHRDNPSLFDQETKEWTEQGQRTIRVLESLTGLRRERLYRGEWVSEVEGALWRRIWFEREGFRVYAPPDMPRVIIGVDPAATSSDESNETGIIVTSKLGDEGYVLGDKTLRGTPDQWGAAAVNAYVDFKADLIVAEDNNGGEMVESTIKTVAKNMGVSVNVKRIHASRGKHTRAEPISSLYEQGKIHHAGDFPELEDQYCTWVPGDTSPDRLDAAVWGFTELLLVGAPVMVLS